jgi:predicted nicotinamide N-methyase
MAVQEPSGSCPQRDVVLLSRLYRRISQRYPVCSRELTIAQCRFSVLGVADTNALLDSIDLQAFACDERLPYWAELWSSAVALAEWSLGSGLSGSRCIELGCGLGLAGIAAARAGARVLLTDYERDALLFARYNAVRNGGRSLVSVHLMDWREPVLRHCFDLVLGADILYERRHALPLLEAFDQLLKPGGAVVLADPGRASAEDFLVAARSRGYEIHREEQMVQFPSRPTRITRFLLRRVSVPGGSR